MADELKLKLTKSLQWQERAKKRIPGMCQLLSKRPDQFSPGNWPGYFSKAAGVEVWDLDDNRYLDMSIGGIGANVLGYADPDVDQAVRDAIALGTSTSLNCPEEVDLADLLCEIHPWADMARFARTGGEAMAVAVRIARTSTGRDKIAFCGYHGWHDWYLAANLGTENALGEHLIAGLKPAGVPKGLQETSFPFRYNRIDELKTIMSRHRDDLAAIVMEPIRNDPPVAGFFEEIKDIARDCGAVFILDEISAGFRLCTGGAHLTLGIEPDIAVFSKALGNGYPIAAIIGRAPVMEAAQNTFISSTYWTERIGPVAAVATIQKHQRTDAAKHLVEIGTRMQKGWKKLSETHRIPMGVGGIAPLSHFSFEGDQGPYWKSLFVRLMLEQGFLASTSFYPMLAHRPEHVDAYLEAAGRIFEQFSSIKDPERHCKALKIEPASQGFRRLT